MRGGWAILFSFKMWFAFFEKGGGAFLHVFGAEAFAEGFLFAKETVGIKAVVCCFGVGAIRMRVMGVAGCGMAGCSMAGCSVTAEGVGLPVFRRIAIGDAVPGGNIGAFDDTGDGEGSLFVDD